MTVSWVEIPDDSDFPLHNLPYGVFSPLGGPIRIGPGEDRRVGVAIGTYVLDLAAVAGADVGLPHDAIREQLGRGVDLVIHMARAEEGLRVVNEVAEVRRAAGGVGVRELWRR